MVIFVKTVGTLKSLEEGSRVVSLEAPEEACVSQVIEQMNLREWEVGFILINGARAGRDSRLADQDQLTLIAPLAGG